ncbi:MAG: porin family protein [Bacteroidetes bacterium]|nr:porin family protein [Bacteroidota bacterium]
MKDIFKKVLVFLVLIWSGTSILTAQDNCANSVINAEALYQKGSFQDAINEITPCSQSTKNKTILWQSYKLLTLCYLYLDDKIQARKYAVKMMEINPAYQPSVLKDPAEFVTLVKTINVIPKFALGVSISNGFCYTSVDVIQQYNVADNTKTYHSGIGNYFGTNISYSLSQNLLIESGLFSSLKKYSITYSVNDFDVNITQRLTYLEVPLVVKYTLGNRRFTPYFSAGLIAGYLLNAETDFTSVYTPTAEKFKTLYYPAQENRTPLNFGAVAGIGLNYKINYKPLKGNFSIGYYYQKGINNLFLNNRYQLRSTLYNYYYMDDDFRINNSVFAIGYVKYLNYKIK